MLKTNLPLLIVKDTVLLPHSEIKLEIKNQIDKKILSLSENSFNNYLFVICTDKDIVKDNKFPIYGLVAQIKVKLELPNGNGTRVTLCGIQRAQAINYVLDKDIYNSSLIKIKKSDVNPNMEIALSNKIKSQLNELIEMNPNIGNSILSSIDNINSVDELTDRVSGFLELNYERKSKYFYEVDPIKRANLLIDDLSYELNLLEYERDIDERVSYNLDSSQREFLLKEKFKVISEELGIDNENPEVTLMKEKLSKLKCDSVIYDRISDEINRYKLCNSNSPEVGILRNYIDTMLSLPWNKSTKDNEDIDEIRNTLNESHYGMQEAKDRILEYIITKKYSNNKNTPIICLVGPPGIGKTSLAKVVAKALKKEVVKISLGGINDEAEITGHRRAYVGAAPGKIIKGLERVGVNNPVFIIDEVDKMTKDIKGDPASSLLEVLDKEQNDHFVDHFVEEGFDLSKVMFILTANYIDKIPPELRDRLEIIELNSYTVLEKVCIARNYILKKLYKEFKIEDLNLDDEIITKIIKNYTKESGVRELERVLRKLIRKSICYKLDGINFNLNNLESILGNSKYNSTDNYNNDIGVINALSYSMYGGMIVKIESCRFPGNGNINYSGNIGKEMVESINVAWAYIKSHYDKFKLELDDITKYDYYVNLADYNFVKDGPSAGINIVTSILSLIKDKKIKNNVSMSGEITLSGKVLKVGGLKEKLVVCLENDIDTLYLSNDNKIDINNLDDIYKDGIKIKFIDNYLDIFKDLFKK